MSLRDISSVPLISETVDSIKAFDVSAVLKASAALSSGKLPTTSQLQHILQSVLASDVLQPSSGSRFAGRVGGGRFSAQGKALVVATREMLEAVMRVGLEKNQEDQIQRFIFACSQASVDIDGHVEIPDVVLPTAEEIAEVKQSLQQLLKTVLTSSELRGVLTDSIQLLRDFFADQAESIANVSITATKASKKAARAARVTEEEKRKGKTGLENVDVKAIDPKDVKKQVVRKVEDVKDDALKALEKKRQLALEYVEEGLPTDAKDAIMERFKEIVAEVQSDPAYEEAISTLIDLVKKYAVVAKESIVEAAQNSSAEIKTNEKVETAATLFRDIIESFVGDLTPLFNSLDKLIIDLRSDDKVSELLHKVDRFVGRSIHDPAFITSSRASRRLDNLMDEARELINSNDVWKKDVEKLTNELTTIFDHAKNDRALVNLGNKVDAFGHAAKRFALGGLRIGQKKVDNMGNLGDIFSDITQVILPRLIQVVRSIPLPRIEYTSPDFDIAIDNIKFESDSFLPDLTRFENHLDLSCKRGYAAFASTLSNSTTLYVAGLRLSAESISYYINKKSGWIGLEDAGLLDIIVGTPGGNDGLDFTITVETASEEDQESFFTLTNVEVNLEGFNISIHDSQHPVRNFLAKPALRAYIQAQFVEALQEAIAAGFKSLDREFFKIQQRAVGASHGAPDLSSYLQALFTIPFASLSGGSSDVEVQENGTGLTKIGADGNSILAIGVNEELLPGKLTGLGLQGKDVVARKKGLENLAEEGRATIEQAVDTVEGVVEDLDEERERLGDEFEDRRRAEERKNGWKSSAFDL